MKLKVFLFYKWVYWIVYFIYLYSQIYRFIKESYILYFFLYSDCINLQGYVLFGEKKIKQKLFFGEMVEWLMVLVLKIGIVYKNNY